MGYIEEGGTLPVPFNMIPSPKTFVKGVKAIRKFFTVDNEPIQYDFAVSIEKTETLKKMKANKHVLSLLGIISFVMFL